MRVEVVTPDAYLGDIMGDLLSRRGLPQGVEVRGNAQVITAMVPLANMFGYVNTLRSMSQGPSGEIAGLLSLNCVRRSVCSVGSPSIDSTYKLFDDPSPTTSNENQLSIRREVRGSLNVWARREAFDLASAISRFPVQIGSSSIAVGREHHPQTIRRPDGV